MDRSSHSNFFPSLFLSIHGRGEVGRGGTLEVEEIASGERMQLHKFDKIAAGAIFADDTLEIECSSIFSRRIKAKAGIEIVACRVDVASLAIHQDEYPTTVEDPGPISPPKLALSAAYVNIRNKNDSDQPMIIACDVHASGELIIEAKDLRISGKFEAKNIYLKVTGKVTWDGPGACFTAVDNIEMHIGEVDLSAEGRRGVVIVAGKEVKVCDANMCAASFEDLETLKSTQAVIVDGVLDR
jgi:hypothetical protein